MAFNQQIGEFWQANQKPIRFLIRFAAIFGISYFILGIAPGIREGLIKPYTHVLAGAVTAVVNLLGGNAVALGTMVTSPRFTIDIAMGCDGVEASCLFLAGVLAYPASWRARIIGLAAGVPAIHLINLGRLVGLYYAGIYLPSVVEEMHVYVAQTIVILFSTVLLILWLDRIAARPRSA